MLHKIGGCLGAVITLTAAFAQQSEPPLDGPHHVFQDALLANMTGAWNLEGTIRGKPVQHSVDAQWVLNHQFLQIHEIDTATSKPGYEALIMIGYDNASDRYVAHWTDIYGGRFSETLGYGHRSGEEIEFVFEYPDGPFHTTFRWQPGMKFWQWQMQTKDQAGRWSDFASLTLRSRK